MKYLIVILFIIALFNWRFSSEAYNAATEQRTIDACAIQLDEKTVSLELPQKDGDCGDSVVFKIFVK